MSLTTIYHHTLRSQQFAPDAAQLRVVEALQNLQEQLCAPEAPQRHHWLARWLPGAGRRPPGSQGLYLWGGVGRGKTWLMDLFFDSLGTEHKLRLHFHHFMQDIHEQLDRLRGHRDPLSQVAEHFSRSARVLCLDEFYVEDISDAMILYRLLDALLSCGVYLVFTSNLAPQKLYKTGLQRERFLPAIELIQTCTQVVHLDGDTDFRAQKLTAYGLYFSPVNTASERAMAQRFEQLVPCAGKKDSPLNIHHRQIPCLRRADDVVWFDFYQLCQGPRASADYIELARRFHTVLISNVPVMGEDEEEWAHRFIDLVDEFYDRRVKLLISAETGPTYLYQGRRNAFEFQRTASRLMEMRSEEYLRLAHRA
ncbi:MAG: cell division protein ZapE [Gammaproteobacteria bacterium]|nr:cell division protein ZapE [Gammaproteobacteria bacterium]